MSNVYRWIASAGLIVGALGMFAPARAVAEDALPAMEAIPISPDPETCSTCLMATSGQTTMTFTLGQSNQVSNSPPLGAQVVSLYLTSISGGDLVFNRLILTHGTSVYDVFDAYTNGTSWYPTALAPLSFPFSGLAFSGPWNMTVIETAVGSNPQLTVTIVINWQMPPSSPPPPPANPTIQGYKLTGDGSLFPSAIITVDGQSTGAGDPYGISVAPGRSHTIVSSVPPGYWAAHSICLNCTNHPDSSFAYGNTVSPYLRGGDYYDLWWKYYEIPRGYVETSSSHDGQFSGCVFDRYAPSLSINVDIYLDGPVGQGSFLARVNANVPRPDINAAYGLTGNHGFSFVLPAPLLATNHVVYVYAIGVNGHDNPSIAGSPGLYSLPVPPACDSGFKLCDGECIPRSEKCVFVDRP